MKRIICIGNRFVEEDSAGYQVFQELSLKPLPEDVELIDGGLAGLDLLRFIEGAEEVVFVDSISGFGSNGDLQLLEMVQLGSLKCFYQVEFLYGWHQLYLLLSFSHF